MASRISVYITSYNQKHYLVEAIDSVLSQTLRPFEIIIVDDYSTDGSQDVIESYARQYPGAIRPFCHARNLGIARNRSFALDHAQGDLVTYLDGDDRFLPEKLELEFETLKEHPEAQIVYSNVYYIDAQGQRTGLWADGGVSPPSGYVFAQAFARDFPRGSLFRNELILSSCLREVGFYDATLTTHEDWDLKIRLTKRFQVAYCPEPLAEYRLHPGGASRSPGWIRLDSVKRVCDKNHALLDDLLEHDRIVIKRKLSIKLAHLARQAARDAVVSGQRGVAFRYWIESLHHNLQTLISGWQLRLHSLRKYVPWSECSAGTLTRRDG